MKRICVILFSLFSLLATSGMLLAQQDSSMEKRLKMREEMHRRMMDKLLKNNGPDQDMFMDMEEFLEEFTKDSFTKSANYKMLWTENKEGRTLLITPKDPKQELKINVSNGLVIIQGKTATSTFSNSFNVPADCDAKKVKILQKDGDILVSFPYLKLQEIRSPKGPSETDVQI